MSSRYKILKQIRSIGMEEVPLPNNSVAKDPAEPSIDAFMRMIQSIGGSVAIIPVSDLNKTLDSLGAEAVIDLVRSNSPSLAYTDAMESVEIAVMKGQLGVGENGAVWVTEEAMGHRSLPFICQHLILVININDIVPTMEQAYRHIDIAQHGFGAFIAGPSKTADIEQSLVIGAHGPIDLTVYLIE